MSGLGDVDGHRQRGDFQAQRVVRQNDRGAGGAVADRQPRGVFGHAKTPSADR